MTFKKKTFPEKKKKTLFCVLKSDHIETNGKQMLSSRNVWYCAQSKS